ncbi:MAG: HtrA protease/chaperone protein [uncultured Thermomicrobiales bacterium]|uniref:HtrA protease/chaperone protein n=1 Tax=uncultured Thermomicrobiales bacterium TaxID=1645740 RepID=A0A6J4VFQ8_9BACT|nr:MAG: HtrA protease/chaperone protein [uncultured Thermomicrobiales bacterium]
MLWRRRPKMMMLALALVGLLALAGCSLPGQATVQTATPAPIVPPTATVTPTATPIPPTPTATPIPPTPTPSAATPREIYRKVSPAVVTIVTRVVRGNQRGTGFGTGVIFDRQGHILTNNHVVEGGQQYEVILADGVRRPATVVGTDPATDLAVMKMDGGVPGIAAFGDSSRLEPGQPVVAIGSALGEFTNTVTTGIVSGLHRDLEREDGTILEGLIQTDAAINPGNSGGPLLNDQSEVIGINTAVIRQSGQGRTGSVAEGIGFSVPSNVAKVVSERIVAEGTIARPGLGIKTMPVTPGMAAQENLAVQEGALIIDLLVGGPAATAGIQRQDVIVSIDNKAINKDVSYNTLLLGYRPGATATMTIARGQDRFSVQVTFGEADQ